MLSSNVASTSATVPPQLDPPLAAATSNFTCAFARHTGSTATAFRLAFA